MPDLDCGALDIGCKTIAQPAAEGFERIARNTGQWAIDMLTQAMTWWVQTPTINPDSETVRIAQTYTTPVIGLVLMLGLLSQCLRMILTRKIEPLIDIALGLVRYAVVVSMGLLLLGGAVTAADALSSWLVEASMPRYPDAMSGALGALATNGAGLVGLLVLGLILALLAGVQWVIGFLRQAGILVLAALLPLAAAGSLSKMGKEWLPKMLPWLLTLVAYKPMAAFIYAVGLTFIGQGQGLGELMVGLTIIALAVIALPAMMKFFSWAGLSAAGGGAMGSALGSFAGARMGGMGGGGGGADASGAAEQSQGSQRAREMEATGPDSGGGGGEGQPSGSGQQQSSGPGEQASGPSAEASSSTGATSMAAGGGQTSGAAGGSSAAAAGAGSAATAGVGAAVGVAQGIKEGAEDGADEMTGGSDEQQ